MSRETMRKHRLSDEAICRDLIAPQTEALKSRVFTMMFVYRRFCKEVRDTNFSTY